MRGLDALGQNYVAKLPDNFRARTRQPAVCYRPHGRERRMGCPPHYPLLKAKSNPTAEVRHVLDSSPRLRHVPCRTYRIRDGTQGAEVWDAKTLMVWLKDEQGLLTAPHLLVVARQIPSGEFKFFLSNVP